MSSKILFKLDHIITDRTQYKPYVSQLVPDNVYVEVTLDTDVKEVGDQIIISCDQLACILDKVATSIEKMDDARKKKKYNL